jgi:hypothetical protein
MTSGRTVSRKIHQLKITLLDSKPPIWRRLLVPSDTSLSWLHRVIQVAMGWQDYHLHQFIQGEVYYGIAQQDYGFLVKDERRYYLDNVIPLAGMKLIYEYDFGDCWDHMVLVEKILPFDPLMTYPVCIKGRRACPPEDVGGIGGYEEFLKVIGDPNHPEYEDTLAWIGKPFDPNAFDLSEINHRLAKLVIPQRKKPNPN